MKNGSLKFKSHIKIFIRPLWQCGLPDCRNREWVEVFNVFVVDRNTNSAWRKEVSHRQCNDSSVQITHLSWGGHRRGFWGDGWGLCWRWRRGAGRWTAGSFRLRRDKSLSVVWYMNALILLLQVTTKANQQHRHFVQTSKQSRMSDNFTLVLLPFASLKCASKSCLRRSSSLRSNGNYWPKSLTKTMTTNAKFESIVCCHRKDIWCCNQLQDFFNPFRCR